MYEITSYYIDDNNNLHTYIGELKHVTISNVYSEDEAEGIVNDLNTSLN